MKKLLLTIFLLLICSTAYALTPQYLCTSGGTWSGSVWVLSTANQATCTGGSTPVTTDEATLNSSSGNVTVSASTSTAGIVETGYTGTMTISSGQTLTITTGDLATLAGDIEGPGTLSSGTGGVTLSSNITSTTLPTLAITGNQTLTSATFTYAGNLSITGGSTIVFVGNWTTGGLTTIATAANMNKNTTETYTGNGGLTMTATSGAGSSIGFIFSTSNGGTLAFGTKNLIVNDGITISGAMSNTSGEILLQGGGITLAGTPTGSTFPLVLLTTASQTLTSGGFNWPGNLEFDFLSGVYTFVGNWYTGGLTSWGTTPMTLNHTTTETYTAAGGISGNALISGTLTQLYLVGGTWTAGGFQPIEVPTTITPSVSNITLAPSVIAFGGTSNTLTYTPSTFSVTTTGNTIALASVTTGFNLNISGLTIGNFNLDNVAATVTLPSTLTLTGTFSIYANSATFSGITTLNCSNFVGNGLLTSTSLTYTFPAGMTMNVSNSILLSGIIEYTGTNVPLIIKSGTASSPIYINYTGSFGNGLVTDTSFTDVQFTGIPINDISQVSNQPTLTRTTGVYLTSPFATSNNLN